MSQIMKNGFDKGFYKKKKITLKMLSSFLELHYIEKLFFFFVNYQKLSFTGLICAFTDTVHFLIINI